MNSKIFIQKILDGLAIGIVVALVPNAVLGALLKPYTDIETIRLFYHAILVMQSLCAGLIGILIGLQFGFNPLKTAVIGAASFIASGVVQQTGSGFMLVGIGDLINVAIFASVAVLFTLYLDEKLGSLTIIFQPILVGAGVGFLGLLALPYVSMISLAIGNLINSFTTLQPFSMAILIAISYAIIIISPVSTVAVSFAIGIDGLASGAANLGVTATGAVLLVGSIFAHNKSGVSLAIFFGAIKMFIPNLARKPIMYLPIITTALISGIVAYFFNIMGDRASAGFGYIGLIGPIKAYSLLVEQGYSNPMLFVAIAYSIPFVVALALHLLFSKFVKGYSSEIYKFD